MSPRSTSDKPQCHRPGSLPPGDPAADAAGATELIRSVGSQVDSAARQSGRRFRLGTASSNADPIVCPVSRVLARPGHTVLTMNIRIFVIGTVALLSAACTVTRQVHLYPVASGGVVQGVIVGHGQGHGTAKFVMPDGEVLLGEYSIVFGGAYGFGAILTSAGAGTTGGFSISGRGEGTASLIGNRGTSAQCEFINANMTGHGSGACRLSNGSIYRMLY